MTEDLSPAEHRVLMAKDIFISSAASDFCRKRLGIERGELEAIEALLIRHGYMTAYGEVTPKGKNILQGAHR